MKLTVPGLMITAILMASPAFAQYGSPSNAPTSGASATKDDTSNVTTRAKNVASHKQKKHMASHKHRHHARTMSSQPQTTGSGSSSASGTKQ